MCEPCVLKAIKSLQGLKNSRIVLAGGTTLVDDVDGIADLIMQLKAGTPPRSTTKTSSLRKLVLKRSELWCRVDTAKTCSDMIVAPGEEAAQPLYGKAALQHLLKSAQQSVKAKEVKIEGPAFMKPFKTFRWLVPEAEHIAARSVLSTILSMSSMSPCSKNKTLSEDIEEAALAISGSKGIIPTFAAGVSTSSSSSSSSCIMPASKKAKTTEQKKDLAKLDLLKMFGKAKSMKA